MQKVFPLYFSDMYCPYTSDLIRAQVDMPQTNEGYPRQILASNITKIVVTKVQMAEVIPPC